MAKNITTCLWLEKGAEEAANFYVQVFKEGGRKAKIGKIARYDESAAAVSGQPKGSVLTVVFELDGQEFLGLNGGPVFKLSPAVSFIINCKDQKDVDYFWNSLSAVPQAEQCGWLTDKFGLSWQVVPVILEKLLADKDPIKAGRTMKAMLAMKKLDIAILKKAHDGE